MNRIYIHSIGILISLCTIFWTGCGDDEILRSNELGSRLEQSGNFKLSIFTLAKETWDVPDTTTMVRARLLSLTDNSSREYDAKIIRNTNDHEYSLYIPRTEDIPDSDYTLTAYLANGRSLGMKLTVTFRKEMLHLLLTSEIVYTGLEGDGTADTPYLIGSTDDFNTFEYNLYRDSVARGAGLYFRQTASFEAPPRSDAYEGRYYACYPFAGIYDGGSHEIKVAYLGAENTDDNDIGLFQTLLDGAQIHNLTLDISMRGIGTNGGTLAGNANGTVTISNVSVEGSIAGKSNIGGFIGYANGNLTATNCHLYASVEADSYAGGLVGYMKDGMLMADNFSNLRSDYTPYLFTIRTKNQGAGGIAGAVKSSGCDLRNITLQHSISEQDSGLKVIYAGTERAGGLVGEITISKPSSFKNVSIQAPISSESRDAGGLIGTATLAEDLTLQGCSYASLVQSETNVGGFFGYLKSENHLILSGMPQGNRVAQVDNGYIAIKGKESVGGMFGSLVGDIQAQAVSLINVEVTASGYNAGGVAGYVYNHTLKPQMFSLDKDMHVRGQEKAGGLIGYAEHCTIEGSAAVKFDNAIPSPNSFVSDFAGTVTDTNNGDTGISMGGIVGYAKDCYLRNICVSGSVYGKSNVGGIAGYVCNNDRGGVSGCVSRASSIKNSKGSCTGGVIGRLDYVTGDYENLLNYGPVGGYDVAAGIIGYIEIKGYKKEFNLRYCVNTGEISGNNDTGGVVGRLYNNRSNNDSKNNIVSYSANYGTISNSSGSVGGIIGIGNSVRMMVKHSANHGMITGNSKTARVGGIAGSLGKDPGGAGLTIGQNMELAYCCNRGTISGSDRHAYVGGLLGYQEEGNQSDETYWMTHDCYNMGNVTSDQDHDNGGIIGCVDHYSEIRRCINVGEVSYGNGVVGTHKSSSIWYHHDIYYKEDSGGGWCAEPFSVSQKKTSGTFKNFDFSDTWQIDSNDKMNKGYPYLKECPFQSIYYTE